MRRRLDTAPAAVEESPTRSDLRRSETAPPRPDSAAAPAHVSCISTSGSQSMQSSIASESLSVRFEETALVPSKGASPTDNTSNSSENFSAGSSDLHQPGNRAQESQKWADVLRSPSHGGIFSPSREMSKGDNMHGLGLQAAAERAKTLSKCGKRMSVLLSDVAGLHEAFAQSTLQACATLDSLLMNGSNNGGGIMPPTSSIAAQLKETSRCVTSFAKQTQGLAICIKGSVARPLHGSSAAMAETAPAIFNRYALTRAKCGSARKNALKMRQRYEKAVADAEAAIQSLKDAKEQQSEDEVYEQQQQPEGAATPGRNTPIGSTPSTPFTPPRDSQRNGTISKSIGLVTPSKATLDDMWRLLGMTNSAHGLSESSKIVMKALEEVQYFEKEYCRLVSEENQAVSRAQTMECMVLESLQKLEEERLQFLLTTIGRVLQAEKGALDKMTLVPQQQGSNGVGEEKRLPISVSAVQEAISLNMPEDVGRWRDRMTRQLREQKNCTQLIKGVGNFFEELAAAAFSFSTGLQSKLTAEGYVGNERYGRGKDTLSLVLSQSEGDRALTCWGQYIESLNLLARAAFDMGSKIQNDGKKLVGKLVVAAEKDLISAVESEAMRWKHCTDHAKAEEKARQRHAQSIANLEKAQDRLAEGAASFASSSAAVSQSGVSSPMAKALGGMLSMFPSGFEDEAYSKMLSSEQRLDIAKKQLDEASAKEQSDKLAYESAQIAKAKAIQSYTATAHAAENQASNKINVLLNASGVGLEVILSFIEHFREIRYNIIGPATSSVQKCDGSYILKDMYEWAAAMQGNLVDHLEKSGIEITSSSDGLTARRKNGLIFQGDNEGFELSVKLVESKNVHKLMRFVVSESQEKAPDESAHFGATEDEPFDVPDLAAHTSNSAPAKKEVTVADMTRVSSMPRMSVATKELKSLADTMKDVTSEKPAEIDKTAEVAKHHTDATTTSAETQLFLAHFWDESADGPPPTVIDSYSCAYWPKETKGLISPLLHGRMFVTSKTMYFVGWGDMKLILNWEDVTSVSKELIGLLDNAIRLTFDEGEGESSYFFGSFVYSYREKAFQLLEQLTTVAQQLTDLTGKKKSRTSAPVLPPDDVLKKMEPVLSNKRIKGVSIQKFYDCCCAEANDGSEGSTFYHDFLEKYKSFDISIGQWEFPPKESDGIVHPWTGEKMAQKRIVKYRFTRTTHLYVGPPTAGVTQTHYICREGDDKIVLSMTVEMDGIPYADCFSVEVRWVLRRAGKDLVVDVGVFVNFCKSTILKSKIQSGTIVETKPIHIDLFNAVKAVCGAGDDEEEDDEEGLEETSAASAKEKPARFLGFIRSMISILQKILTSAPARAIASNFKSFFSAAMKNTIVRRISLAMFSLLIVVLGWKVRAVVLFWRSQTPLNVISNDEITALHERMDKFEGEMQEIRDMLQQLIASSQPGNSGVEESSLSEYAKDEL